MYPLNIFFLTGNTVLLLLVAVILVKEHYRLPSAVLGAVLALAAAAIGMFDLTVVWDWRWLEIPLNLVCASAPVAFWLLAKSLFEDRFRWRWSHLGWLGLMELAGAAGHYFSFGDFRGMAHWIMRSEPARGGLGLVPLILLSSLMVLLALHTALKDWRTDLVESRRRARILSLVTAGGVILIITGVEFSQLGNPRSLLLDTLISGVFFVLILGICIRFLGLRRRPAEPAPTLVFAGATQHQLAASEGDRGTAAMRELERLLQNEKIYRQTGLTIRSLAERLGMPEYRLRRLINGHLGYRNFNDLLNRYRIEDVAHRLLAPETRHLPVLSIALDTGYQSLSPFNKAFKEIKGMTPTEYRQCFNSVPGSEKSTATS